MTATIATIFLEAGDKDLPVVIILPLAIIIPLAVLLVFSLIKPRGGGH